MRKDIIDLCNKHIEECESLEKKRFTEKYSSDRSALFAGGGKFHITIIDIFLIILQ